ncbi:MAG TPA: hypothetical protein VK823_25740 [Streptosporangiaceae bacterium]|nr:hypothetical protein [Streptosporangiaceae bacterium]
MAPESTNGQHGHSSVESVPQEVAELAAELSEAEEPSRRKRIAAQIADIAGRSGQATWRTVQSGSQASVKGLKTGSGASARGLKSGGQTAWTGLQSGGQFAGKGLQAFGRRLTREVLVMAPKIPIRNISTLREQNPGRDTEELADKLIDGAARASAGFGAAVGAAAVVPFIPTAPVELGVETLALVAVELKLIAELHEVYGMPAPGSTAQRMTAYVASWANRRGVQLTEGGVAIALGSPVWRKLERRLLAKVSRSALSLAPLLAGAAAGAVLNHHETRKLGNQVREDLRKRAAEARAIPG